MPEKIRFKDLSGFCKVGIIGGVLIILEFIGYFIYGMILAFQGGI